MGETESRPFGALLRAHRVAAGLSQEGLAERAHLSRRTITNLERGVTAPYRETVAMLADALELPERERAELEGSVNRARTTLTAGRKGGAAVDHPPAAEDRVLLETKLAIPPARSGLIARLHLVERLQAGLRGPLTLLSAPAGSGKTTLLSAWRMTPEGQGTPLAWVSLDAGDSAPGRFWRYVFTALDRAVPGVGTDALGLLDFADASTVEAALTALVNALSVRMTDVVLILDDYHVIEAEPIHPMLGFLLDHRPPCLHMLLSARADPPLPLARLRARGEVTELRAADLRFRGEETAAFLDRVMGLALPADEVAALESRTEGWIAGLQLAGLSLQGRSAEETASFIADFTGSHRYIVDYLLDEVLLRQPEEMQRFLLHTCILDRLCAPLCAAVIEGDDPPDERIAASQQSLEMLERNNVFIVALDDERRWYRYHHLFADALRQRQSGHAAIRNASVLYRRAAAWFAGQDLIEEAIVHALAGGCYDLAADLIPRAIWPVAFRGKMRGLSAWLQALPETTLRTRPDLALFQAWIMAEMRAPRRAEDYLLHAEEALKTRPEAYTADERVNLGAFIGAFRAIVSVMDGDPDGAMCQVMAVLGSLPGSDGGPESSSDIPGRSGAIFALGLAHLGRGETSKAAEAFRDAAFANRADPNTVLMVKATLGEACAHRMAGNLDAAGAAYERAIAWYEKYAHPALLTCNLFTGLADIRRERNELDASLVNRAEQSLRLERALGVGDAARWIELHACNLLVLARIKQAQGDFDGALADVREGRERLERFGALSFAAVLTTFEAQLYLAKGYVDAAARRLQQTETREAPRLGLTPQVLVYTYEHLEIAPIQVLIAQGRASRDPAPVQRALSLIDGLQEKAQRSGLLWLRAKALVLRSLALQAPGERAAALSALEDALALAETARFVRLFLDEGPAIGGLLRDCNRGGTGSEYAAEILAALEGQGRPGMQRLSRPDRAEAVNQHPAEALTNREIEVLRLLADGQSTPEIARALYVEVNTVRTHVKHLYGKLGVHSRDQAVWRAREGGLLS